MVFSDTISTKSIKHERQLGYGSFFGGQKSIQFLNKKHLTMYCVNAVRIFNTLTSLINKESRLSFLDVFHPPRLFQSPQLATY